MNFPVPHLTWDGQKSAKKLKDGECYSVTRKANEDKILPEFHIKCPRVGIQPLHKSQDNEENTKVNLELLDPEEAEVSDIKLSDHHTLPVPLFAPTPRKCGRGPIANNLLEPNERQKVLLGKALENECRLLETNMAETGASIERIQKAWKRYVEEGKQLPVLANSLQTVLDRYGCEEVSESYAGGNLATLNLNGERFLIHSFMEWDCALCLSRMTSHDITHPPIDIKQKVPLDDGPIYQITVPLQTIERDSELLSLNDKIFATRQLHTTRLWKATYDDRQSPSITKVQEYYDRESTVRFLQLNPDIWGEFCELRHKQITLSRDGYLTLRREVSSKYERCFYAIHPRILMLVAQDSVDIIDTRCRPNSSVHSAFSMDDKDFRAIYSVSPKDRISCFSPSSRENINYMTTGRHLFVWDVRLGKRPLSCTPHLMDAEPCWLSSVAVGPDKEWLFLDAVHPSCSGVVGYNWTTQRYAATSNETMPAVNIQIESRSRLTPINTLECLRYQAIGLDWAVKNRFEQQRSGVICDKESDGTILSWQCNAAGDVFVQQLNVNEKYGFTDQVKSSEFTSWMSEWTDAVVEFEDTPTTSTSVEQSEHFNCEDVMKELKRGFGEEELTKWQKNRPEPSSSFTSPRSSTAGQLEQYCAEDFTKNTDPRGSQYNRVWGVTDEREAEEVRQITEESFTNYRGDQLISSTPMFREDQPNEGNLHRSWLATPLQILPKPNPRLGTGPFFSSTPMLPSQISAFSSRKSSKKPAVWDDF